MRRIKGKTQSPNGEKPGERHGWRRFFKGVFRFLLVVLIVFVILGFDHRLETTVYDYTSAKVPEEFEGFRIVQISDFHLEPFGREEETLISAIKDCSPDIIVMTGDIVDEDHEDITPLKQLLEGIQDLAPIYFVSGNHDLNRDAVTQFDQMEAMFAAYGVTDLDDSQEIIRRNSAEIRITGVRWRAGYFRDYIERADQNYFNILLYHGGDYFDLLSGYGYDLLLAGHIHGGIIRIPFIGGLLNNDRTLFPKYDAGAFETRDMSMVLSRGLGDAYLPRFYNRPELVCVELHTQRMEEELE